MELSRGLVDYSIEGSNRLAVKSRTDLHEIRDKNHYSISVWLTDTIGAIRIGRRINFLAIPSVESLGNRSVIIFDWIKAAQMSRFINVIRTRTKLSSIRDRITKDPCTSVRDSGYCARAIVRRRFKRTLMKRPGEPAQRTRSGRERLESTHVNSISAFDSPQPRRVLSKRVKSELHGDVTDYCLLRSCRISSTER